MINNILYTLKRLYKPGTHLKVGVLTLIITLILHLILILPLTHFHALHPIHALALIPALLQKHRITKISSHTGLKESKNNHCKAKQCYNTHHS